MFLLYYWFCVGEVDVFVCFFDGNVFNLIEFFILLFNVFIKVFLISVFNVDYILVLGLVRFFLRGMCVVIWFLFWFLNSLVKNVEISLILFLIGLLLFFLILFFYEKIFMWWRIGFIYFFILLLLVVSLVVRVRVFVFKLKGV